MITDQLNNRAHYADRCFWRSETACSVYSAWVRAALRPPYRVRQASVCITAYNPTPDSFRISSQFTLSRFTFLRCYSTLLSMGQTLVEKKMRQSVLNKETSLYLPVHAVWLLHKRCHCDCKWARSRSLEWLCRFTCLDVLWFIFFFNSFIIGITLNRKEHFYSHENYTYSHALRIWPLIYCLICKVDTVGTMCVFVYLYGCMFAYSSRGANPFVQGLAGLFLQIRKNIGRSNH
jgi:hypothetical protein